MQRTPAGLPCGMPGMGLEIEGAVQQAPQCSRHFIPVGCGIPVLNARDAPATASPRIGIVQVEVAAREPTLLFQPTLRSRLVAEELEKLLLLLDFCAHPARLVPSQASQHCRGDA